LKNKISSVHPVQPGAGKLSCRSKPTTLKGCSKTGLAAIPAINQRFDRQVEELETPEFSKAMGANMTVAIIQTSVFSLYNNNYY